MEDKRNKSTNHLLKSWYNFRIKIIFEGMLVGIFAGLAVVFYRLLLEKALGLCKEIYKYQLTNKFFIPLWVIFMVLTALLVGYLMDKEPMASGSGIPQVEGLLLREFSMDWFKIIIYKLIGGTLSILGGLSLGREGPSIQIGASVGQGFSKLFKRVKLEEKFLITSGASAGLSAAFNAPLSGVIFALEEVHKNFSPIVLSTALTASITADFISKQFFGINPVFNIKNINPLPLKYYGYLIVLGVILALFGVLFNKSLLKTQDIYNNSKKLTTITKPLVPFLMACLLGLIMPQVLGGGHSIVESLVNAEFTIKFVCILLIIKFIFTMISYGSGAPGGIFLPLLVIGALIGNIYGKGITTIFNIDSSFVVNFIVLAMAGYFTAIVKAPITGIILITEMTGSFSHLLSISVVSITAYVVTEMLASKPIYELLLERMIKKGTSSFKPKDHHKVILETAVCLGSELEGKLVKDINWPKECLLVAIKRGDVEIIPRGDTKIYVGDYVIALSDEEYASNIRSYLSHIGETLAEEY